MNFKLSSEPNQKLTECRPGSNFHLFSTHQNSSIPIDSKYHIHHLGSVNHARELLNSYQDFRPPTSLSPQPKLTFKSPQSNIFTSSNLWYINQLNFLQLPLPPLAHEPSHLFQSVLYSKQVTLKFTHEEKDDWHHTESSARSAYIPLYLGK